MPIDEKGNVTRPKSAQMMPRETAEAIIRSGGSVAVNDGFATHIVSNVDHLDRHFPAAEESVDAADPVASNEAKGKLDDEIAALQARRDRLQTRIEEAQTAPEPKKESAKKKETPPPA